VDALGLERAALYRLLPGGEIVPVVACGQEPPLEHVGGSVTRLEERALSKRAFDGKDVVVVRGSGEDPILPKEGYEAAGRTVVVGPMFGHDTFLAGEDGELDDDHVADIRAYADLVAAFLEQGLDQERLTPLGDLTATSSRSPPHELRAPVAVIHGIGVTLNQRRDRLGSSTSRRSTFAHLVNQLLDLSRLEVDAIGLRRQEIEVKPLVESIVSNIADEVAEHITVEVVVNALKYGAPPVTITAEQRDRHFRLAVEDRGSGVGKDFVPRLFERFAHADGRRKDGSGLGLAIAQSYANAHGGELIYGDAEPSGARFELVLPRPHGDT
jgi:signal transduction histidine kinase